MSESTFNSRKLNNLRVIDLRNQLEIRQLDKTGVKQTLIDRLKKALESEGYDPNIYEFQDISLSKRSTLKPGDIEDSAENSGNENVFIGENEEALGNLHDFQTEDENQMEEDSEVQSNNPAIHISELQNKMDEIVAEEENNDDIINDDVCLANVEYTAIPPDEEELLMQKTPIQGESKINENEDIQCLIIDENDVENSPNEHLQMSINGDGILLNGDDVGGCNGESIILSDTENNIEIGSAEPQNHPSENAEGKAVITGNNSTTSSVHINQTTVVNDSSIKGISSSRNLWVSGLSSSTRAADLKTLFSKYGKVTGAKVVTNAKSPGAKCYGFVTMMTIEEASKCIQYLHRTELHGRMISVERAKADPAPVSTEKLTSIEKPKVIGVVTAKSTASLKAAIDSKNIVAPVKDKTITEKSITAANNKKTVKGISSHRDSRSNTRRRSRSSRKDQLTLDKIRLERERERNRERERMRRMEERRQQMAIERERNYQREITRKQREEAIRLEREKEHLRMEKQKLELERLAAEREKIALERERQRQEREKLEKEREERRIEMQRKMMKRPAEPEPYWAEPKRSVVIDSKSSSFRKVEHEAGRDRRGMRESSKNESRFKIARSHRSKEKSPLRKIVRASPPHEPRATHRGSHHYESSSGGTSWHAPQSSRPISPRIRNYDANPRYTALPGTLATGSEGGVGGGITNWSAPSGRGPVIDSTTFLSSAANILMGVGLNNRRGGLGREERYKTPLSRRY